MLPCFVYIQLTSQMLDRTFIVCQCLIFHGTPWPLIYKDWGAILRLPSSSFLSQMPLGNRIPPFFLTFIMWHGALKMFYCWTGPHLSPYDCLLLGSVSGSRMVPISQYVKDMIPIPWHLESGGSINRWINTRIFYVIGGDDLLLKRTMGPQSFPFLFFISE